MQSLILWLSCNMTLKDFKFDHFECEEGGEFEYGMEIEWC